MTYIIALLVMVVLICGLFIHGMATHNIYTVSAAGVLFLVGHPLFGARL